MAPAIAYLPWELFMKEAQPNSESIAQGIHLPLVMLDFIHIMEPQEVIPTTPINPPPNISDQDKHIKTFLFLPRLTT